ncbi:MAG TPA: extracellular solute-binding protein, partial [Chloroflexota bacterium]|nr:extracellular solute-binding protein [Chloroflexota bacterium]
MNQMPGQRSNSLSRRALLRFTGAITLLAVTPLVQACSSSPGATPPSGSGSAGATTSQPTAAKPAGTAASGTSAAPATQGNTASGGKQTVEVWTGYGQGRMATAREDAINHFNQTNPKFEAKHVLVPWGNIHDKVIAATAAKNPPDVYRGWSWIVGTDAPIGGLTQLDDYIKAETNFNLDDFWPPTLYQMKYQGKIFAVSCSTIVNLLFYNKDRMQQAGLDTTSLPTDLEGWEAYGSKMMEMNGGRLAKIGFIPFIPPSDAYSLFNWGAAFGGTFYNDDTSKVTANDPANVKVLQWFKTYADKYGAANIQAFVSSYGGNNFGRNTPDGVYYTGLLAIWNIGCWNYNDMKEYGPKVNFGVTKMPMPKGVQGKPGQLNANMYLVPKGAKNPEGGFAICKFMSSDPWVAANFEGVPDSVPPSRQSLATSGEVAKLAPWFSLMIDALHQALPFPSMPG